MDMENDASLVTRGILRRELCKELNALDQKLTIRIFRSEANIERRFDELKEIFGQFRSEMIGHIQGFAGMLENYKRETIAFPDTLDQHGKRLDNHEERIRSLES